MPNFCALWSMTYATKISVNLLVQKLLVKWWWNWLENVLLSLFFSLPFLAIILILINYGLISVGLRERFWFFFFSFFLPLLHNLIFKVSLLDKRKATGFSWSSISSEWGIPNTQCQVTVNNEFVRCISSIILVCYNNDINRV